MASADDMITCRTIGHAWYPVDATRRPKIGGILMSLRCERCTSVRNDISTRTGRMLHRDYDYVNGYRDAEISAGSKDDKRAWLLKELLQQRAAPVVDIKRARRNA